jgi:hypothetical protein
MAGLALLDGWDPPIMPATRRPGPFPRTMGDDRAVEPPVMDLVGFLLARIAEDTHAAAAVAEDAGAQGVAERRRADCAAKRKVVLACQAAAPDLRFLGTRPPGLADFPLPPRDLHQLAALTLALLATPYADHPDFSELWRP